MPVSAGLRQTKTHECFVVMPFGKKPLPDGRTYDFDKVYRVIIDRAVKEAGMRPRRADEIVGSRLIHTDMFKALRDRHVVLADLSLENPNVFYELGLRHVMSASGTVLMCRKGTTLPFDVGLSRVIFYDFDGVSLDYEEVQKTVTALKLALQQATNNELDSPVHTLLHHVFRFSGSDFGLRETTTRAFGERLLQYQKDFARGWLEDKVEMRTLLDKHMDNDFGLRALGYYYLEIPDVTSVGSNVTSVASKVASQLMKAAQYDLAAELYAKLKAAGKLAANELLDFAATYVDASLDLDRVDTAIGYVRQVLEDPDALAAAEISGAPGHCRFGSLLERKWELTEENAYLTQAIDAFVEGLHRMQVARSHGSFRFPGMIAHTRLKLLTLRRIRDSDQQDPEEHRDGILKIQDRREDNPVSVSFLHWAQAIALADLHRTDEAIGIMTKQLREDANLRLQHIEVGGRQYLTIRRFLEKYGDTLTNMGVISRYLGVSLRS
jgi:hypothetical protein